MNPRMDVNVFFLDPSPPSEETSQMVQQLFMYDNIRINRINLTEFVRYTPIEQWYLSGILRASHYPHIHTSDFMRLVTLWKFGGIYLDLDVMSIT